jgi:hypothetical protein
VHRPVQNHEDVTDDETDIPYNPLYFWEGQNLDELKEFVPKPKLGTQFPPLPPYHRINFCTLLAVRVFV